MIFKREDGLGFNSEDDEHDDDIDNDGGDNDSDDGEDEVDGLSKLAPVTLSAVTEDFLGSHNKAWILMEVWLSSAMPSFFKATVVIEEPL